MTFNHPVAGHLPSLAEADQAQRRCRACALHTDRTRVVMPEGPREATLFVLHDTPIQKCSLTRPELASTSGGALVALLAEHGYGQDQYANGNCCACDTPSNRRPTRSELQACSKWLHLSLTRRFSPRVVLSIGATASCLFYSANTLSVAIERAAAKRYIPELAWAFHAGLRVVPVPQTQALSAQRRSFDGKPWSQIAREQVEIAVRLARDDLPYQ